MLLRSPLLTSHKWRELLVYPPGVWFADDAMTSFSVLPLFCFASFFVDDAFVEAAALHPIVLRYAGKPHVFFPFFLYVYLEMMSFFPSIFGTIHCRFLIV